MTTEHDDRQHELFPCARRVLEAGLWLVENGYGRVGVLPYVYATGHWRCEFYPLRNPSKPFFRYSAAQEAQYLANHCGGSIQRHVGPDKLAQAILVSVPEEVKNFCAGPASAEVLRWIAQVRAALADGFLPSAFSEYSGGPGQAWQLLPMLGGSPRQPLNPMPGHVHPGSEPKAWLDAPWREGRRQLDNSSTAAALVFSAGLVNDPQALQDVADQLASAFACSADSDHGELLAASIGMLQAKVRPAVPPQGNKLAGRISTTAASDPVLRRGTRLLSMVHELHKAGYQHLRIVSCWTDRGTWRARLLPASDVAGDGWSPLNSEAKPLEYDSADGTQWFGWNDAHQDDARTLAVKFLARFPDMAAACAAEDWVYAGWFTRVLGRAECGELPVFFGLRDNISGDREPPPPLYGERHSAQPSPTDWPLISNRSLVRADLPDPFAEYDALWPFCLSYDGYHAGLQSAEACLACVDHVSRRSQDTHFSLDLLRTAAFILQRRLKHAAEVQPIGRNHPDMQLIHDIVEKLRERLPR